MPSVNLRIRATWAGCISPVRAITTRSSRPIPSPAPGRISGATTTTSTSCGGVCAAISSSPRGPSFMRRRAPTRTASWAGWRAPAWTPVQPQVCTGIHGDGLVSLQFRRAQGGQTEEVQAPLSGADVIQLERKGNTYSMSAAHFGEPFTTVQAGEIDLGEEVYLGLFVCSHEDEVVEKATFQDVRIVAPVKDGFDRGKDPFGSRLEILDVASGQRQIVYSRDDVFEAPNWTRDGKALIFNSAGPPVPLRPANQDPIADRYRAMWSGTIMTTCCRSMAAMLAISSHAATRDIHSHGVYRAAAGRPAQADHPHRAVLPARLVAGRQVPGLHRAAQRRLRHLPHPGRGRARKPGSPTRPGWTMGRSIPRTAAISTSTRCAAGGCRSGACNRTAASRNN